MSVSTVKNDLREANRLNTEGVPKTHGSTHEEKTDSIRSQIISKQPSTETPSRLRAFATGTAKLLFVATGLSVGAVLAAIVQGVAASATGATAATVCKSMAIGLAATGSVFLIIGVVLGLCSIVSYLCHIASKCCDGNESERARLKRDALENH